MPLDYEKQELIFEENFMNLDNWYHEGIGNHRVEDSKLFLDCIGSQQGDAGCMFFFRKDLPDQVLIEYEISVFSKCGIVINYLAMRGLNGEDLILDKKNLEPRTGIMKNYYSEKWGLQSYHLSFCRYDDNGVHTGTSNWRKNPGMLLVGHGDDKVREIGQKYKIKITKDSGFLQLYVDDLFCSGVVDRDESKNKIPDSGKFGFRLVGSDVKVEVQNFKVFKTSKSQDARKDKSEVQ